MGKKFTINVQGYESTEVLVFGIQAPLLPIHRLAFFLNRKLEFNLCKKADFPFYYDGSSQDSFDFYTFSDEENHIAIHLVSNKSSLYLLNKYTSLDYLLFIQGSIDRLDIENIFENIENIENIFSLVNIPIDKIKDMDIILSDMEEHLDSIRRDETFSIQKLKDSKNL